MARLNQASLHQHAWFWRLVFPALFLLAASAHAAPLPLRIQGGTYLLHLMQGTDLAPLSLQWQQRGASYTAQADGLQVTVGPLKPGLLTQIPLQVQNTAAMECLVQSTLAHHARVPTATAAWWDGHYRVTRPIEGLQRLPYSDMHSHLPLAALATGPQAIVLGRTPEPLNSYFKPTLHYRSEGASDFTYSLRMVLAPGQTDQVSFVAGVVPGAQYDLRAAAWQAYMDSFPTYFRPTPGISDTLLGSSIQYQSWNIPPDLETLRRMRTTWDWCYAPFKRAGDMWGRAEEWDYKPLKKTWEGRKVNWLGGIDWAGLTVDDFHKRRAAYFEQWGYDAGQLFYNPSGAWVEKQLAERSFPDAIVQNKAYQTERGPWVTHWDSEVLVQPQGTSYWPRIKQDIELAARELDICGFAFDVFSGVANYGPTAHGPLAGRAWDERGVYVDIGLGMIDQAKLIHSLKVKDKPFERLGVAGGGGQCAFFSDAGLLELILYGGKEEAYPLQRMSLGSKPAVMWKGWSLSLILSDLDTLKRRDFLESFSKIADYVRLKSFQWGIYPTYPYIVGVEPMQRDMPLLTELVRDGWQPLAPVSVQTEKDAQLWVSRYGQANQGAIVVGNPQERDLVAALEIAPVPGQQVASAYVNWRTPQVTLDQQVASLTKLALSFPAREATVFRIILNVQTTKPLQCRATVRRQLDQAVSEVVLTAAEPVNVTLKPASLPGYVTPLATLNGANLTSDGKCKLKAGTNTLTAVYPSDSFRLTQSTLDAFPFTDQSGKISFSLAIGQPESRLSKRVARRLQEFFNAPLKAGDAANLKVLPEGTQPVGPVVRLRLSSQDLAGWTAGPTPASLLLTARDEEQAVALTLRLLEALEPRYPLIIPFKSYAAMPARFGLLGKTLHQAMREEGLPCGR